MQPAWEVADVLRQADLSLLSLNTQQQKTLRAIEQCRTIALGGHIDVCTDCATIHISYNSCRNRHCPKCQGHKREQWIQCRIADLLPCSYYHLVFTLPQTLNPLALANPALVYHVLFKAVWQTLQQFGNTAGLQLGMIAVLHTWVDRTSRCIRICNALCQVGESTPMVNGKKRFAVINTCSRSKRSVKYSGQSMWRS